MNMFKRMAMVAVAALVMAPAAVWAASPYAGDYSGTFTLEGIGKINDKGDEIPSQNGDLKIKIDDAGKLNGTVNNKTLKEEGTVSGQVGDDGKISVTIKYKDQEPSTVTGSVTSPKDGKFEGLLKQKIENAQVLVEIKLKK